MQKYMKIQPLPSMLFGMFNSLVMNQQQNGEQLVRKSQQMLLERNREDKISSTTLFNKETMCVVISGEKVFAILLEKTLQQILTYDKNFKNFYNIESNQMVNRNINDFMPQIFSINHIPYMTRYLETGKEVVINKKRIVFALNSNGYVYPTHIYVKFNPDFQFGISYIGLLKPHQCISRFTSPPQKRVPHHVCERQSRLHLWKSLPYPRNPISLPQPEQVEHQNHLRRNP